METHDFLDAVRHDSRWDRIKRYIKDQRKDSSSIPLSMLRKFIEDFLINRGG